MIASMFAAGWRVVKVEAALPSVRRLGFSKVVVFARGDDEIAVFE